MPPVVETWIRDHVALILWVLGAMMPALGAIATWAYRVHRRATDGSVGVVSLRKDMTKVQAEVHKLKEKDVEVDAKMDALRDAVIEARDANRKDMHALQQLFIGCFSALAGALRLPGAVPQRWQALADDDNARARDAK